MTLGVIKKEQRLQCALLLVSGREGMLSCQVLPLQRNKQGFNVVEAAAMLPHTHLHTLAARLRGLVWWGSESLLISRPALPLDYKLRQRINVVECACECKELAQR